MRSEVLVDPHVSVVIPTRIPDSLLNEAVKSALLDIGEHGEVIVVVDGQLPTSFDAAWLHDGRVRTLILGQHSGTPAALNAGLRAARYEFVLRLDADDIAVPGRARRLAEHLAKNPAVVCVGSWARLVDAAGAPMGSIVRTPTSAEDVGRALLSRNPMIHSSVMYRRNSVASAGWYNERCMRMQDYDLFLRLALTGRLENLPETLVRYRIHGSQSSRKTSPYANYTRIVIRSRYRFARAKGKHPLTAILLQVTFWFAQVLRHHGLRRARHLN